MFRFIPFLAFLTVAQAAPDFSAVYRLLDERCIECHTADDPEASLVLETFDGLMKGGETSAAIVVGKSAESLLLKYLRGEVEKDGKKKFMPPGKREKLSADDIALIAAWIDAGAKPPAAGIALKRELHVPKIAPKVAPRQSVNALAFSPQQKLVAVGRYGTVELLSADTRQVIRKLEGHQGNVNALAFSPDGAQLFAASGENSLFGEVRVWNVADGVLVRTIEGHRDTLYALALSPDGQTLATGSYDQQIKLWDTADGTERKTLRGHNGAVFALAFRPDGKLLASASADRTIKLWDVASGQRRDTLSQPTKEQNALAWSPDGKRLVAGGADNRLRVYEVSAEAKETTNPLAVARFAHDGSITRLAWNGSTILSAAQDGSVKLWDTAEIKERAVIEQSDWPNALAFLADGAGFVAGRVDGTLGFYQTKDAQPLAIPPAKLGSIEPRGVQRGVESRVILRGSDLAGLRAALASDPRIRVQFSDGANANEAQLFIAADATVPRGSYDISLTGADGKNAGWVKLFVDDLPQISAAPEVKLPAGIWGTLAKPGESVRLSFDAKTGQTLIFDLVAKPLGSKTNAVLTLLDADGKVLTTNHNFGASGDPLIAAKIPRDGRYTIVVSDAQFGGSAEHFFRLDAGELAFVTGTFPLSVGANHEGEVELTGFNLPADRKMKVTAAGPGEMPIALDPAKFRHRAGLKIAVSELALVLEAEPNDEPAQAVAVAVPAAFAGRIGANGDRDLCKFDAKKGSVWAIETHAAERGSPVDTKIEVLDANGKPIERALMQAVRDSSIAFRAVDSATSGDVRVENWREMELNQWLWMNGEIVKLFRAPEGPDSGFALYQNNGARRTYFGTSPSAHALDQPCYIVEPRPPGAKLVANGLPIFPLYFANDDDGDRKAGRDSRLLFIAPADGSYLVRVSDSRGLGGENFAYQLIVRAAQENFSARIDNVNLAINVGSGQSFTVTADRVDGFDGDVFIEMTGIPEGYQVSQPLIIQAGHLNARGTLVALPGAKALEAAEWTKVKVLATAKIADQPVTRDVNNLGTPTIAKDPQIYVALEPAAPGDTLEKVTPATPLQAQDPAKPFEITIAPGEIIPAWVKIKRNDANGDLRFDVDNLPHGVIVDNLGLSGITILAGKNEGEIALRAEPWVTEQDRLCFAISRDAGRQSSLPVMLHVRMKKGAKTITVK